jgi:glutamyl-tRNA synthetase
MPFPETSLARVTRLAPSPTGALHLGNARTFLINWAMARRNGWRIVLRIEDLDGPRVKFGADQQAIEDLRWLGLDWDTQAPHQTSDLSPYRAALDKLAAAGLLYPCTCSRREIEQAQSAPHAEDHELRYPGTCRGRRIEGESPALRLVVPDEAITFHDEIHGPQSVNVQQQVGDFVVATRQGLPAYQLAVVVDDAEMNVTHVVRGDDLVDSTPRQLLIYEALGLARKIPAYTHVPLVVGPDGRRLAKRHGDTRLSFYRDTQGVSSACLLRMLARWCGIEDASNVSSAADLIGRFRLQSLSREPIVFDPSREGF